jgi:hypothetical protein
MSYGLKYQSEFYNRFGKLVQVQIAKKDYVGASSDIKTQSVEINVNFQGYDTPIIGTGAKVIMVNEGAFDLYNDLLTSLEKQFLCTIVYDSVTVFKGYSICDLNEQNFISNSSITLQFTDYIHRLDGSYLSCVDDISGNTDFLSIIHEAISTVNLHSELYVNSTLFESTMASAATDTFLEQTYVENNLFFSDGVNYDNTYELINKILKVPGAYIYSMGDKWVIERQEDIGRTGNWVSFSNESDITGASETTLNQAINKQNNDFEYINISQKIIYTSGLQKLILNLKDKSLDTFVFNNYAPDMATVSDETPEPGSLTPRTWYIHEDAIGLEKKYNFRGMGSCLKWTYGYNDGDIEYNGIYYAFDVQFNVNEDKPTELTINYTMSSDYPLEPIERVELRFALRVDGGSQSGSYVAEFPLPPEETFVPILFANHVPWSAITTLTTTTASKEKVWTISKTIDLTTRYINGIDQSVIPSVWDRLGNPSTQRFILMIWPPKYYWTDNPTTIITKLNYLGDVSVTLTQTEIPNKITYYINEDFIKTEEIDIDLFDLNNINYCNGMMTMNDSAELVKTDLWTSENSPSAIPLVDIFAKNKFRNYARTIHKLIGTISYDGYLKPFTVITDDNLFSESSADAAELILLNYTWDLNNGTYDIEAEEYTDEQITLDTENGVGGGGPISLTTPVISSVAQSAPDGPMVVQWGAVTGALYYRVQRKPTWYTPSSGISYWADYYSIVYSGSSAFFSDNIQEEGTAEDEMIITYKVCAYNSNVETAYSAEETGQWYTA